jgi:hypothetical protein
MKYFFEIENWQKYFGCIYIGEQGSNASTTSMYPTPLILIYIYIYIYIDIICSFIKFE